MAVNSEDIWEALALRLAEECGSDFTVITRKRREYGLEEHPVLMVLDDDGDEELLSDPGDPMPTWKLTGELLILARAEPDTDRPASSLNALVRSVRSALERHDDDPAGHYGASFYTDLGGLIAGMHVRRVEKGSGPLTGQAVAKVQLEIETNPS